MPFAPPQSGDRTEVRQVMDGLRQLVHAVRKSSAQTGRSLGLTSAQLIILKLIRSNAGLSVNDLAVKTLTHQSTVSEVLGRLESRGLVMRQKAEEDGRRRVLSLTPQGVEALETPVETIQEVLMAGLSTMSPSGLTGLARGLTELIETAGLSPHPATMFMEDGLPSNEP